MNLAPVPIQLQKINAGAHGTATIRAPISSWAVLQHSKAAVLITNSGQIPKLGSTPTGLHSNMRLTA